MRIGCLQFAPQVGDVDNNLNRADGVLNRANPEDLDLLVLPELAFTGYNFNSLDHISPFLEPSGSGITSLWARTTALKYNCAVAVGYPEKVDVSGKWPTGPEYYNSAIIVNGDGETIANYRKRFLYYTDETWALEGDDGFFEGYIPGLGHTSMGICMDLNPYKFQAPWHAFEFAFHILEYESNFVIVSMAWMTREDGRIFSRMPNEPDMETLTYWVTRLEPLIRAENNEEIIVVFANRTGSEDDAIYAGTSAVVGIQDGEVKVYGLLGRGSKELLIVDTSNPPYAKLVYRPDPDSSLPALGELQKTDISPSSSGHSSSGLEPPKEDQGQGKEDPTAAPPGSLASPMETALADNHYIASARKPQSLPHIQIPPPPVYPVSSPPPPSLTSQDSSARSPAGSFNIPTPSAPSPTPMAVRPKLIIPQSPPLQSWQAISPQPQSSRSTHSTFSVDSYRSNQSVRSNERPPAESTPYPESGIPLSGYPRRLPEKGVFGGRVSIAATNDFYSPITPFDEMTSPVSPRFWWPPTYASQSPMEPRVWPSVEESLASANAHEEAFRRMTKSQREPIKRSNSTHTVRSSSSTNTAKNGELPSRPKGRKASRALASRSPSKSRPADVLPATVVANNDYESEVYPARPSSPKSRNASRSRVQGRSESSLSHHEVAAVVSQHLDRVSQRVESVNRNRSRSKGARGVSVDKSRLTESRVRSRSQAADSISLIPIAASPSILGSGGQPPSVETSRPRNQSLPRSFSHTERTHAPSRPAVTRETHRNYGHRSRSQTPIGRRNLQPSGPSRSASRGRQRELSLDIPLPPVAQVNIQLLQRNISPRSSGVQSASTSLSNTTSPNFGISELFAFEKFESVVSPSCPLHGRHSTSSSKAPKHKTSPRSRHSPPMQVSPGYGPSTSAGDSSRSSANSSTQTSRSIGLGIKNTMPSPGGLNRPSFNPVYEPNEPSTPKAMIILDGGEDIVDEGDILAPSSKRSSTLLRCRDRDLVDVAGTSHKIVA